METNFSLFEYFSNQYNQFINYYHYKKSSHRKNVYVFKLLGEKFSVGNGERTIIFKTAGSNTTSELYLADLLSDRNTIGGFHPLEAKRLGELAFKEIILESVSNPKEAKYFEIKEWMLASESDHLGIQGSLKSCAQAQPQNHITTISNIHHEQVLNFYPYRIVSGKANLQKNKTFITYHYLGKRDGFIKPLQEIISKDDLVSKFHPSDAFKLGFIARGDTEYNTTC